MALRLPTTYYLLPTTYYRNGNSALSTGYPRLTPECGASRTMDCRTFRKHHFSFIDTTVSEADLIAMQGHIAECERCATYDTALRRALLVFRNLPSIQPSPDFGSRLSSRLRQISYADSRTVHRHGPGVGTFAVAASTVIMVGVLATAVLNWTDHPNDLSLPPVVATLPDIPASPILDRSFVSSASAGMPVWPAAVLAEQAPVYFMNAQLHLVNR